MSINIVDRRKSPKGNSSENRQRLLKRIDGQIKKALPDIVKGTNVKDLTSTLSNHTKPIPETLIQVLTYIHSLFAQRNTNPAGRAISRALITPHSNWSYLMQLLKAPKLLRSAYTRQIIMYLEL